MKSTVSGRRHVNRSARKHLDGNARQAERVFGWSRNSVSRGLIDAEMQDHAQADPKFQTAWCFTRATAENVRQQAAKQFGVDAQSLPSPRTFRRILNRRGFRLRRVQKTKPIQKIPQTDAIFANNPIERCWSALERHWNGTLLTSVTTAVDWMRTMTWKTLHPVVNLCETIYERGVRLTRAAFAAVEARLERAVELPRWSVRIQPRPPEPVPPAA